MRKRFFALLLTLALLALTAVPAFAATFYVYDDASVFTEDETAQLNILGRDIRDRYNVDAIVAYSKDCGGKDADEFAREVYAKEYGGADGIVFCVNNSNGDRGFYITGKADDIITEDVQRLILSGVYNAESVYEGANIYYGFVVYYLEEVLKGGEGLSRTMPAMPGQTETASEPASVIPEERQLELLVDNAELLTPDERDALNNKLADISNAHQVEVAVVTVNSLDGKGVKEYADDFYDYNGYGCGENDDGILLLLAMDTREWAITTYGSAIDTFTDYRQSCIMNDAGVLEDFGKSNYDDGFNTFADECNRWLTVTVEGYDDDTDDIGWPSGYLSDPDTPKDTIKQARKFPVTYILIAIAAGLLVAFVVMKIIAAPLKSVTKQSGANNYIVPGSMSVTNAGDIFLYSNVTRTAKPKDNDSSYSGGGSSTNDSSSGRSHGGSSGSF